MTKTVKTFIEETIDLIDKEQWFLFFMNWYNCGYKEFPDTEEFNELMSALKTVGLDDTNTRIIRESVLITVLRGDIDMIRQDPDGWAKDYIPYSYLLTNLYSTLGLDEASVHDCIFEAVNAEGLDYDPKLNGFTWSKLCLMI